MYDALDSSSIIKLPKTQSTKSVMLSFDDGPSKQLPLILDVLQKEKVPAIFFWQSRLLHKQRPWKRVLEEGHKIGTHSSKHLDLVKLTYEAQHKDIKHSVEKIELLTGQKVKYFRPPFGRYNEDTLRALREIDLELIMWRVASMDWDKKDNPPAIKKCVMANIEDRAIILLHELKQTVEILPELIQEIREQGYEFTLLS